MSCRPWLCGRVLIGAAARLNSCCVQNIFVEETNSSFPATSRPLSNYMQIHRVHSRWIQLAGMYAVRFSKPYAMTFGIILNREQKRSTMAEWLSSNGLSSEGLEGSSWILVLIDEFCEPKRLTAGAISTFH